MTLNDPILPWPARAQEYGGLPEAEVQRHVWQTLAAVAPCHAQSVRRGAHLASV